MSQLRNELETEKVSEDLGDVVDHGSHTEQRGGAVNILQMDCNYDIGKVDILKGNKWETNTSNLEKRSSTIICPQNI